MRLDEARQLVTEAIEETVEEQIGDEGDITIFDDKHKYIQIHTHSKEKPGAMAYRKFQVSEARKEFKGELGQLENVKCMNDSITISYYED